MMKSLRCVLLGIALGLIGQPVAAQSLGQIARGAPAMDPALKADIERLMDVTGAAAAGTQMAASISDAFLNGFKQTQGSAVPPRVIELVKEVLTSEFAAAFAGADMRESQVALYAKHFTHDDVRALLAFYQTEIGKKAIAVMPTLAREGAEMGQEWAKANMPRILRVLQTRLKEEGFVP
jgi:uncharacterized protein